MSSQDWASFFPHPVEKVYAFFADTRNLNRVSPAFLRFEALSPERAELTCGLLFDYQLRIFGFPIAWRTRIEEVQPPRRFCDAQVRGPYAYFLHQHDFYAVEGGTLMVDRVQWRVRFGPLGMLANELWVRRTLDHLFRYRRRAAARLLG